MSYIKNVVIKNLTITGLESGVDAVLGDNITTVLSIDYYESIFEPVFVFEILFMYSFRSFFCEPLKELYFLLNFSTNIPYARSLKSFSCFLLDLYLVIF